MKLYKKNSDTNSRLKDLFVEGRIILNPVFEGIRVNRNLAAEGHVG
jgi:hypothetical protein